MPCDLKAARALLALEGPGCRGLVYELVEGFKGLAYVLDRSFLLRVEMRDGRREVVAGLEFAEAVEEGR